VRKLYKGQRKSVIDRGDTSKARRILGKTQSNDK
jgi:hypothetical protein